VDLKFAGTEPTDVERAAVDELLGPPDSGWHGGPRSEQDWRRGEDGGGPRDQLLPCLHAVNDRVGWISEGALGYICRRLTVPPAEAYGVATFYSLFAMRPTPPKVVHVCTDIACQAAGAGAVRAALADGVGFGCQAGPCLGVCERAPAALVVEPGTPARHHVLGNLTPDGAVAAVREPAPEPPVAAAAPQPDGRTLLARVGVVDPDSLADYRARGGYRALRRAVRLGPGGVIRELIDAKLVGRGGAAFPTGRKWDAVARQPVYPHYLVCNADESEPGTFKDRVLMEGDPGALVEAMTIAGYATGCRRGYLYLRGEYPRAYRALAGTIEQARAAGLLGPNVMGFGFEFDIELRRGAGAYICGEETAIFGSIEGYRGEPRTKPPFPVERGLFGKPTVVNNVETLYNVLPVLDEGGPAFAATGSGNSTGTKLFCLSGAVRRPGVYEVPFGATLRDLLDLADPAGPPKAVLLGGAAGGFLRPDELDLPLTFEAARGADATLGSGVVLVIGQETDLPAVLLRIAGFFRDESCGQCVPCRIGTVRQEEALARIVAGRPRGSLVEDVRLLRDVGRAMRDASICGLGQTAWNAVESAIDRLDVFGEVGLS
jgi:NADH-quinone oxidoreductase subunit F